MADSLVSGALKKIISVAGQQFELFAGATHELKTLEDSFQSIQAVLRDAESKQVGDERVRVWLSMVKHVAYDIDDVLDEWEILGLGEEGDYEGGFINKVCQCLLSPCNCLDHVVSRYKVASHVKEIRERLAQIDDDKNKYNFSSSSVGGDDMTHLRRERQTSSLIKSEMFIGRESDKEILLSRLVSGSSHEDGEQVHVVAVVGIGGLGKTTLAQQIYHDGSVKGRFDKVLWVCVSDVFDVIKLTKAILEELGEKEIPSELNPLQKKLRKQLKGKCFFLVLDDVWNDNEEKWKKLEVSLTSGDPRSRILVTTRSERVANTMKAAYTHGLKGLSDEHSWTLFSSRAFAGRNVEECLELECIGRKIVSNCKGVPLSIKLIGSAMQSKRTVEDWENVSSSNAWSSLPQATDDILPALLLTYSYLPLHLKQCFAYCSMFPKDWEFNKDMLVRLWAAQGFVRSEGNRETEDVGAEHFDELVAWSMFQEVEDKYQGTVCKMHDLLHDLAEFVAKDDIHRFISVEEGGRSEECPGRNVRHAFVSFTGTGDSSNNMPITLRGAKKLRTLFIYGVDNRNQNVMLAALLQQSRFLRSVVFQYCGIEKLPKGIGKMKHLRYLDLSRSDIVELPESVSHLLNLRTLNLNDCYKLKKLPRGIGRMVSLRHLEIEGTDELEYLPKGLGRISGLRSLCKFIVGGGGEGCRIDELQILNTLHGSLQIEHLQRVSSREEAEKAQLGNKTYLRRLVLSMSTERDGDDAETERMDNVLEGLRPHENLEELELYWHRGSRLPSWMDGLRCLRKLVLLYGPKMERLPHLPSLKEFSIFSLSNEILQDGGGWERLVALQKLKLYFPKLRCLPEWLMQLQSLQEFEIGECEDLEWLPDWLGQLKKLKSLVIDNLRVLRCLPDSLGQLESLENLQISFCEKLESLPDSLGELKALNRLEIWDCKSLGSLPDRLQHLTLLRIISCPLLSERCKRDGGEDWPKISHIPYISIDFRRIR